MHKILNGLYYARHFRNKVTTIILIMHQHFPQEILKVRYRLLTISYKAPKIWNLVPKEMK